MGVSEEIKWKKPRYQIIEWYKKDPESLINMEKELESMLGNKTGFYHTMEKIKIVQNKTLRKKKRIRVGRRGEEKIQAAEWIDEELRDNIRKRSKLSRRWRLARKRKETEEDVKRFEKKK